MVKHPWDKWNLGERPKDEWDRISSNGYLGKMQSKFNVDGGFGVYVIELNSDVWEESIRGIREKERENGFQVFQRNCRIQRKRKHLR